MNHYLKQIALNTRRVLLRNWLLRSFFLLVFLLVTGFHVALQSNLTTIPYSGAVALSAFIPYMNAWIFTLAQGIPVVFLTITLLERRRKIDSLETIYTRPESNADYVGGVARAMISLFMGMAAICLLPALLIHWLASAGAPFGIFPYLFYLVTLTFPAVVFSVGLSAFAVNRIGHPFLSAVAALGTIVLLIWLGGETLQGLLNPFGTTLPNVFSGATGHPQPGPYLLQRLCWLLTGGALLLFSVFSFKRLPNTPAYPKWLAGAATLLLLSGIACGTLFASACLNDRQVRRKYTGAYERQAGFPKASVAGHALTFRQEGKRMQAHSDMRIVNRRQERLDRILLYLNPGLEIESLCLDGEPAPYSRTEQVVWIDRSLEPGREATLTMAYSGEIDGRICYADVPEAVLNDQSMRNYMACRFGKKYHYLSSRQTLLIPECLWYPVSKPPVNPASPYHLEKDYTRFTLTVEKNGPLEVASQGIREEENHRVVFRPEQPLPGITLSIGDYVRYSLAVDSTEYTLYLYRKSLDVFQLPEISGVLPDCIRRINRGVESSMGGTYPYRSLTLVETPIAFAAYHRPEHGYTDYQQPGMLLFPERGIGIWEDFHIEYSYRNKNRSQQAADGETDEKELLSDMISGRLTRLLIQEDYDGGSWFSNNFMRSVTPVSSRKKAQLALYYQGANPYYFYPQFDQFIRNITSDEIPVMDIAVRHIAHVFFKNPPLYHPGEHCETADSRAVGYLKEHSFKEAVSDPELDREVLTQIIQLKSEELLALVAAELREFEPFRDTLSALLHEYRYRPVGFDEISRRIEPVFGFSWSSLLDRWYHADRLPTLFVGNMLLEPYGDELRTPAPYKPQKPGSFLIRNGRFYGATLSFDVYNASDAGAIVSLRGVTRSLIREGEAFRIESQFRLMKSYHIPPHSGMHIRQFAPPMENWPTFHLDLHLTESRPSILPWEGAHIAQRYSRDTVSSATPLQRDRFGPPPGEYIADNADPGFRIHEAKQRKWLHRLTREEQELSDIAMNVPGIFPHWNKRLILEAYGQAERTLLRKSAGNGSSWVEWEASLEKAGNYELFIYLPPQFRWTVSAPAGKKRLSRSDRLNWAEYKEPDPDPIYQYYRIRGEGVDEEAAANVNGKYGWISLGTFRLPEGTSVIRLSDRSDNPDNTVFADAVKWVLQD